MSKSTQTTTINSFKLLKARELLAEAASLTEFTQAFTLFTKPEEWVELNPEQVTGLYYALGDIAARIRKAEKMMMS